MSERAPQHDAIDTNWVIATAKQLGFDLCGVVPADLLAGAEHASQHDDAEHITMQDWLARGFAGEMRYLHDPRRSDLASVVPEARSVVVCALNYDQPVPYSTEAAAAGHQERGWISRYAWGDDYHDVVGEKLQSLLAALRTQYGDEFAARWYVDTGPISERAAAKVAGLGWVGKNTCLINEEVGSWLFLGVIITSLDFDVRAKDGAVVQLTPAPDLCGNCRLCLDACPTGALVEPYVMDARRCISYLTIELRGTIPEEFRADMGWQVFGCDICQDVCPWNRGTTNRATTNRASTMNTMAISSATAAIANTTASSPAPIPGAGRNVLEDATHSVAADAFAPRAGLVAPELSWLLALTEEEYREHFRGSPVKRTKWRGLIRNACIAAGNALRQQRPQSGREGAEAAAREAGAQAVPQQVARLRDLLRKLAAGDDPVIAEHAQWALAQAAPTARMRGDAVPNATAGSASVLPRPVVHRQGED